MESDKKNKQKKTAKEGKSFEIRAFRKKKKGFLSYIFPLLVILVLVGSSFYRFMTNREVEEAGISQLYTDAKEGKVEEFVVSDE